MSATSSAGDAVQAGPPAIGADVAGLRDAPAPPPASEACPLCGAPLAREQDWCLRCGAAARTRVAITPRWRPPLVALLVAAVLCLAVLAAALVKLARGTGPAPAVRTTTVLTTPGATTTPGAATTPGTTTTPGATTTPGTTTTPGATTTPGTTTTPGATTTPGTTTTPVTPTTPGSSSTGGAGAG